MPTKTLPVRIDRDRPEPLGVQLSTQVRDLVLAGTLVPGDRLPSTRALALDLGVARSVTEQAYDQLLAEGWLTAQQGAGTFVASGGAPRAAAAPRRHRTPAPDLIALDLGSPWIDPRHAAGWRRAWREVSTIAPPTGYPDQRGIPELRVAIADRLARTRGLAVDPDEVLLTSGTTDGLRQLLPHLPPGPVGDRRPRLPRGGTRPSGSPAATWSTWRRPDRSPSPAWPPRMSPPHTSTPSAT